MFAFIGSKRHYRSWRSAKRGCQKDHTTKGQLGLFEDRAEVILNYMANRVRNTLMIAAGRAANSLGGTTTRTLSSTWSASWATTKCTKAKSAWMRHRSSRYHRNGARRHQATIKHKWSLAWPLPTERATVVAHMAWSRLKVPRVPSPCWKSFEREQNHVRRIRLAFLEWWGASEPQESPVSRHGQVFLIKLKFWQLLL